MRKVFDWLLAITLVLSSIFYIPGKTFSDAQDMVYMIGIFLLFIFSLYLVPLKRNINPWFNSILVLAVAVFVFGETQAKGIMIKPLVQLTLAILLFYMAANHCKNRNLIYNAISCVVIVSGIIALMQFLKVDPICLNDRRMQNEHITALFGYKHALGAYMALAAPLLIFSKRWIIGLVAVIVCVMANSWASIGIMVIGLLFGLFYYNRKFVLPIVAILLIACSAVGARFILKPQGGLDSRYEKVVNQMFKPGLMKSIAMQPYSYKVWVRFKFQSKLMKVAMSRPYIGTGIGTFIYLGDILIDDQFGALTEAWNDYLELFITMGAGILFLLFGLYHSAWIRFKFGCMDKELIGLGGALITIPIGIALHTYMNYANLSFVCIVLLGLLYNKTGGEK